ncbi:MAG: hypothetical protein LUC31_00440 [Coprobacillus sp.]|nr:hypothetical protein [Coprobacillus sp.]
MNLREYNLVKDKSYNDYFHYLGEKYGYPTYNYPTMGGSGQFFDVALEELKKKKSKDGLFVHHLYECYYPEFLLAVDSTAKKYPIEFQYPTGQCYCTLLEHMLLHILIGEAVLSQKGEKKLFNEVCANDIIYNLIPTINDAFNGRYDDPTNPNYMLMMTTSKYKKTYIELLKRFKEVDSHFNKRKSNWFISTAYKKEYKDEEWDISTKVDFFIEIGTAIGEEVKVKKIK